MDSYREPARLLRLMAHPMRLEILTIVRGSDECVCHLSAALKKSQPYVSQQLAILRKEELIIDHKEGNNVFYGLVGGPIGEQLVAVLGAIDKTTPRGHQVVAGCYCPKCEPGGACSLPVAAA
jgi:DNA-binding transcriptional ArsR family regulator